MVVKSEKDIKELIIIEKKANFNKVLSIRMTI